MMQFIYQYDESSPKIEISLTPSATLTEALEQFEAFLHAAGYQFDGVVDILLTEEIVDTDEAPEIDEPNTTLN